MTKKHIIGVIGEREASNQSRQVAFEVGVKIAQRGGIIVCGGLGGVMEAAAKGAKSAGGLTIGILPCANRTEANPYIDIPIVTDMGEARNIIIVRSCEALIAVGGSFGTLSEIAFGLKLGLPIVGIDTWYLTKKNDTEVPIIRAKGAEDAVEKVWMVLEKQRGMSHD